MITESETSGISVGCAIRMTRADLEVTGIGNPKTSEHKYMHLKSN